MVSVLSAQRDRFRAKASQLEDLLTRASLSHSQDPHCRLHLGPGRVWAFEMRE